MTLEECIDYAIVNNYNRQSVKLNESAREDLYDQSRAERLPGVSASVSETLSHSKENSSSWTGNYGLSANMTLWQGGSLSESIRQSRLQMEQTGYRTTQYDNELTIQILQAFLTVLGNEELLKYQETVLEASEEQVRQGREHYRLGQILESDYLLFESQYASDQQNIRETRISRDNSLLTLKGLLSFDTSVPFDVIAPDTSALRSMLYLPSEGYVLETALDNLPDLEISRYDVEIAQAGLKISRSGFYPTVSLGGSIGTGHVNTFSGYADQLNDRLNEQIGVTVSIPIFNKNKNRSNVTQSKIALQQAELSQRQTELELKQTIIQEYRNTLNAAGSYRTSEIKQNAYWKSFETYRNQFQYEAITAVELLQQQNNYISAMNEYIQNKYGFLLQRKILDVYMGERITM